MPLNRFAGFWGTDRQPASGEEGAQDNECVKWA
jgi:hypothetical protein